VPAHKWIDATQPQTLQAAVILSYINAVLAVVYLLVIGTPLYLLLIVIGVAALGIANERRLAYHAAIVLSGIYLFLQVVWFLFGSGFGGLLSLLFAGVLFALLIHPQSREYQRIWFR
jgi:uncharacterized membrane protein YccF (DUF307 family)